MRLEKIEKTLKDFESFETDERIKQQNDRINTRARVINKSV